MAELAQPGRVSHFARGVGSSTNSIITSSTAVTRSRTRFIRWCSFVRAFFEYHIHRRRCLMHSLTTDMSVRVHAHLSFRLQNVATKVGIVVTFPFTLFRYILPRDLHSRAERYRI